MVGDYYWVHPVIREIFIEHQLLPGTMLDTEDMKVRLLWSLPSQSLVSCGLRKIRYQFDFILGIIKETALLSLITENQHLHGFVSIKVIVLTFCNCKPLKWFTASSISWLERCPVSVRHFLNFGGTWLFSFVYTCFIDCIAKWSSYWYQIHFIGEDDFPN